MTSRDGREGGYSPCSKVRPPKLTRSNSDIEYFTLEQTQCFLKALDMEYTTEYAKHRRHLDGGTTIDIAPYRETRTIPTQFKVFYHIALFGGLRRGEILGLTWDDVNFKESSISISKSIAYAKNEVTVKHPKTRSSNRKVSLPQFVITLLRQYRKEYQELRMLLGDAWESDESGRDLNWLFIQSTGKLMHPSTPYGTFKDILTKYNAAVGDESKKLPDITLHGLRHTHLTLLIAENMDIRTVSARLGHAKTSTTLDIYTHAIKSRDTAAADTLDTMFDKKDA